MKPGSPPLQSSRLLDQVRERIRYLHYSLKTEKACLYWVRFFVRWSATQPGNQALSAIHELLGHSDVSTTMIYPYVLEVASRERHHRWIHFCPSNDCCR